MTIIVCGSIPEHTSFRFFIEAATLLPGVERGGLVGHQRRVLATKGYEDHVKLFVQQWNERHTGADSTQSPEWIYGVTTIPSRIHLLAETLDSLFEGGFTNPVVYVDDVAGTMPEWVVNRYEVVYRGRKAKTYRHWLLSLLDLYTREPAYDRYALFQDDVVCYRNLRSYLDRCVMPDKTYWNLYTGTFSVSHAKETNVDVADRSKKIGFISSNQKGHGAQGLVFTNEAVMFLFQEPMAFKRMWDPAKQDCSVDGFVGAALHAQGFMEHIHVPSLLQHIGKDSSMGHGEQPTTPLFYGQLFDAMQFLKIDEAPEIEPGLGTAVAWCLSLIGITPAKVTEWLGAPCNCEERKRKLDELTAWAKRCMRGRLLDAKRQLLNLISGD